MTYMYTYMHACMHAYIHAYIHTYIHTYLHTYILTYLHTYILTYLHTYIYIHTYVYIYIYIYIYLFENTHLHAHERTCLYVYIHMDMYICIYMRVLVYMYTHMMFMRTGFSICLKQKKSSRISHKWSEHVWMAIIHSKIAINGNFFWLISGWAVPCSADFGSPIVKWRLCCNKTMAVVRSCKVSVARRTKLCTMLFRSHLWASGVFSGAGVRLGSLGFKLANGYHEVILLWSWLGQSKPFKYRNVAY